MNGTISKEAAERLFNEYSNYVYRGALFFTKSKELADDITQEVFIQIIRKYDTYDPSKPIKPWIYKIMLNKVRNVLSREKYIESLENVIEQADFASSQDFCVQLVNKDEMWEYLCKLSVKTKEIILYALLSRYDIS